MANYCNESDFLFKFLFYRVAKNVLIEENVEFQNILKIEKYFLSNDIIPCTYVHLKTLCAEIDFFSMLKIFLILTRYTINLKLRTLISLH